MGRPATKPKKLKDGFYLEIKNRGERSGIKLRRDTEQMMLESAEEYNRVKEVVILGESVNGKFKDDPISLSK